MARPNLRPRRKAPPPFLALPTELRLQIHNYLLLSMPSYNYTHTYLPHPRPRRRRRRYTLRQHGMLLANRQLHAEYAQAFYERTDFFFYVDTNTNGGKWPTTVPFCTLPPALLPNLRKCELYVILGMMTWELDPLREALVARIEALLGRMDQVQWVHLAWKLSIWTGRPLCDELWERLWERLGERFVQRLKGGAGMRGMTVTVGNRILKLERKGAEWVERE